MEEAAKSASRHDTRNPVGCAFWTTHDPLPFNRFRIGPRGNLVKIESPTWLFWRYSWNTPVDAGYKTLPDSLLPGVFALNLTSDRGYKRAFRPSLHNRTSVHESN